MCRGLGLIAYESWHKRVSVGAARAVAHWETKGSEVVATSREASDVSGESPVARPAVAAANVSWLVCE